MRKVLLIGEVSLLAEDIEFSAQHHTQLVKSTSNTPASGGWLFDNYTRKRKGPTSDDDNDDDDDDRSESSDEEVSSRKDSELYAFEGMDDGSIVEAEKDTHHIENRSIKTKKRLRWMTFTKHATKKEAKKLMGGSEHLEMEKLLGEWEEPEIEGNIPVSEAIAICSSIFCILFVYLTVDLQWKKISIKKILQFRETLNYMDGTHPLSVPFGTAGTRKQCMTSAQRVYTRLLMKTPESPILHFDTVMMLAIDKNEKLQKDKARALIRLFRPDRNGHLTLLDFVKSCDQIFKRLKMFRVTTANSAQLDDAFEQLVNIVFYFFLTLIVLSALGVDPQAMFLSLTGLLLPLSFLFSAAASKYFEVSMKSLPNTVFICILLSGVLTRCFLITAYTGHTFGACSSTL
jgi:hypothetical protein